MSMIQKLLGGPDFFMKADEATLAKIKPVDSKPVAAPEAVAPPPVAPEPPKVEAVVTPVGKPETAVPESDVEAVDPVTVTETVVTEPTPDSAPAKTVRTKKKKSTGAAASAGTSIVAGGDDIQALVDSAIAQASISAAESEQQSTQGTFATDFLLTPAIKGRRKPGPSLAGFMDMAGTMKR